MQSDNTLGSSPSYNPQTVQPEGQPVSKETGEKKIQKIQGDTRASIVVGAKIKQTGQGQPGKTELHASQKPVAGSAPERTSQAAQKQGVEHKAALQEALTQLTDNCEHLTPGQMMGRLETFNGTEVARAHWGSRSLPKGSLFNNISCPEATRLSPNVHANWIDENFAGFMYPSNETRGAALEAMMEKGITRHAHLANDFAVWLQHENTGPIFPMSSKTFEGFRGERKIDTELGEVTLKFGDSKDGKGLLTISGTVRGRPVERTVEWPLDSLTLPSGLKLELASSQDHDTYVFKNENGQNVHTLEVDNILWKDFEGIHPSELHHLANRLVEVHPRSAGCRAGVGRTGTLFVAVKMLEWKKANPNKPLTNKELLQFVAEGRINRDQQLVQTEKQMSLLTQYMTYLNDNPDLSLKDRMNQLASDLRSVTHESPVLAQDVCAKFRDNARLNRLLTDPTLELTAEDEALLDEVFELLLDPISGELMNDPVVTPYGHTFDRESLTTWFSKQRENRAHIGFSVHRDVFRTTCPFTRQPLSAEQLSSDIFAQRLKSLLMQRATALAPATEAAKTQLTKLEDLVVSEPLHWCRLLSAVMPKNSYFIRSKSFGGTNDYVVEYRGDNKVQKCGFRINANGEFQPTTHGSPAFKTLEELVKWVSRPDKSTPTPLSQATLQNLNNTMGKSQFMANLHKDANLMTIIKHLEMRYEDAKVDTSTMRGGYVRAGVTPSSFPCFTHRVLGPDNKIRASRMCVNNGVICDVLPMSIKLKPGQTVDEAIQEYPKFTQEQKDKFKEEYSKVKDKINPAKEFTLFIPTENPVAKLTLASVSKEQEQQQHINGYVVAF